MDDNGNNFKFRQLEINEIECKISKIKPHGLQLLLYKTARTDIAILNETVGAMNWQCEYAEIKGNMYCSVSIYDIDKYHWVTKWDCGEPSDFGDVHKGEASDAFKRACFKWGLGVELYTAPYIWIPNSKCNIQLETPDNSKKNSNERNVKERYVCNDRFVIEKIAIENHAITGISILNKSKNNERVFMWHTKPNKKADTGENQRDIDSMV